MITFGSGNLHFNFRAVGIILDGDRVLLHRGESDDFWTLPGGRCELMESAQDAIQRETREELSVEVRVERLVWVVENFFEYTGKRWHELALYFLITLPPGSPLYAKNEPFLGDEGGITLIFQWYRLAELGGLRLLPSFLREGLKSLPASIQYITHTDGKDE